MKTALIHFGLHKTGSSSIQKTLGHSATGLAEEGWLYPDFEIFGQAQYNHSVALSGLYCTDASKYHMYAKRRWVPEQVVTHFQNQFQNYLQHDQNLILSGEDLSNLNVAQLRQFHTDISSHGYSIHSVAFLRSPISGCTSSVQQRVKGGQSLAQSLNIFSARADTSLSKALKIRTAFPQTEFYSFDEVIDQGGPVAFFCRVGGLPTHILQEERIVNSSLSMGAIRLLGAINETAPMLIDQTLNFGRDSGDHVPFSRIKGENFQLLRCELEPIYEQLLEQQLQLEKQFDLQFTKSGQALSCAASEFAWTDELLRGVTRVLPLVNSTMAARICDYFFSLIQQGQLSRRQFHRLRTVAERREAKSL
ncbi:MAG: hypothetical protein ACSHXK_01180 [Oceanococcus sp.]